MSYDPYALAFPAPAFTLSSREFAAGGALPLTAYAGDDGPGESPELTWSALPQGTRSVVVTAFDADAPIPGGLWHWAAVDIPAGRGGLEHGAGAVLPALPNSLGVAAWSGVKPPPGTGVHRLFVCATALSVEHLDLPPGASPAMLQIVMIPHTLGRAILVGTSTAPPA
ncbi:YbhB/YbcL family Raf kinase inhibitor-like protein [Actinoplanes rectilineatus]|uniref:YbhB/YbcL family Raf kinase inhibitor-like protein n=1 Tax=Actinoplanes rectilineatus TaxID=113571 RepID=UPI000A8E9F1E|nr:YbhB/YbcL family Raf kinase inhibitor-like protein [Actinoplanes rectilineatus]